MPTYNYRCKLCGFEFKVQKKMTDEGPSECPNCKKNEIEQILNPPFFILKGSGFFVNDYVKKKEEKQKKRKEKSEEERIKQKRIEKELKNIDFKRKPIV